MTFSEQLNNYIKIFQCSGKELSEVSGLSATVISRYRKNERIPDYNSSQFGQLIDGLYRIALNHNIPSISKSEIKETFMATFDMQQINCHIVADNFNHLVTNLNISMNELARFLNFDASYLSRIRSKQRKPADISSFLNGVCHFVIRRCNTPGQKAIIAELLQAGTQYPENDPLYLQTLVEWMLVSHDKPQENVSEFLRKIDEFDLEEYIQSIHFNDLKVPSLPFQIPISKNYYGLTEMKHGELDFFKSTILSKTNAPVFMCSDMPMEDMAEDLDFGKKWMFAIAMMLKKGLHLNIIHNVDRPFKELLLGLESWIPIYMTGQVSPFYLKGVQNNIYCHLNYVSGAAALTGECINGFHHTGKYYLTKNKEELAFYTQKTTELLSKAHPLMEIYDRSRESSYQAFLAADSLTIGSRHNSLSSLPIYTIPLDLLKQILQRNLVSEIDQKKIVEHVSQRKEYLNHILQYNAVTDDFLTLTQEEFEDHPMILSLSGTFFEQELYYSYEEYLLHYQATLEFAENQLNYHITPNPGQAFRNIQISIHQGDHVLISKSKAPVIHFVIRHPKLQTALENFIPPIMEEP